MMSLTFFLSPQAWLIALGIFVLRICDVSTDTIRVIYVVRGRKRWAWVLGFVTSLIYIIAISVVLTHLDNPLNVIGYAAGFATGNIAGMLIEERLAMGYIQLTVVSPTMGPALIETLRANGFGVTEVPARGKDGMVTMLICNVMRKHMKSVEKLISEVDPQAFVTAEEVHPVRRGFWSPKEKK